jgi:hypothetical protein
LIYLSKPPTTHGHGQKLVNTFDGLPMVKDATLNSSEKWQVFISNHRKANVEYGHLKVWRYGLEVAIKIKGSQENRRFGHKVVQSNCFMVVLKRKGCRKISR